MLLSVVTTLYRSAPYIDEFYRRVCRVAETLTSSYEIIFVNDGSPDDSLDRAIALHQADPRVKVADLSRNFGHHKALLAGLEYARGDLIYLLDSDLEEEPEALVGLYERLRETGADVAYGVRRQRHGSFTQRLGGRAYFWAYNAFSSQPIPTDMCTSRVMTRRYVDSLLQHTEREVVLSGVLALTGYQQVPLPMEKGRKSTSSYSLTRSVSLLADSITSQSSKPLVWMFGLGAVILVVTITLAVLLFFRRIIAGVETEGWTSLILSVWMIGGLMLFAQGLIAMYIAKIFLEVKQRPRTITRHFYTRQPDQALSDQARADQTPSVSAATPDAANGRPVLTVSTIIQAPEIESQESLRS